MSDEPTLADKYEALCSNFDLARQVAQERIDEWSREDDPHGWWHERSTYIALLRRIAELEAEKRELLNKVRSLFGIGVTEQAGLIAGGTDE